MLEIRDRVLLKDGCSILSTVGGRRFRVLSGGEKDGYDTAQVEFLRDTMVQDDQLLNLLELHDKVRCQWYLNIIYFVFIDKIFRWDIATHSHLYDALDIKHIMAQYYLYDAIDKISRVFFFSFINLNFFYMIVDFSR